MNEKYLDDCIRCSSIEQSSEIGELAKALVAFHRECPTIKKSDRNPFLGSYYAGLPTILDTIKEPLVKAGLSIVQIPVGKFELSTTLMHESGQWIRAAYYMEPLETVVDKTTKEKAITPQTIGSVITYQRRYAIGAVLCLNIDTDDDANAASTPPATPKKTAAELLAEQKAKAEAVSQPSASSLAGPEAGLNEIASNGRSEKGVNAAPVDGPATELQIAKIRELVAQVEDSEPGFADRFVVQVKNSRWGKLANLNTKEAEDLLQAVGLKNIEAFFHRSLETAA